MELEHELNSQIAIDYGGRSRTLNIVELYKHMGARSTDGGSYGNDSAVRFAAVRQKAKLLKKKLSNVKHVRDAVKSPPLQSLLMSRGIFQAGGLPELKISEYQ